MLRMGPPQVMHSAPLSQCSISCAAQLFFFWCPLNNRDNKVLRSSDGTQCPQAAWLDPCSVWDPQLTCIQQSLLLPLLCCPALHMQTSFPKAEIGTYPQLARLCLPLYDTILSLGFFHEAGKAQVPPNDHHISPQKGENLTH